MSTPAKGEIVNKVKQSEKLVTVDLQQYYDETPIDELDLSKFLFEGLILKEKEFRNSLEEYDWSQHEGRYLTLYCSTNAIIAKWAYMLVAQKATPFVKDIFEGQKEDILHQLYVKKLDRIDWATFEDKFVLLKGCSDKPVPESVYLYATQKLLPHVGKLMYGEACSNVPVYRKET